MKQKDTCSILDCEFARYYFRRPCRDLTIRPNGVIRRWYTDGSFDDRSCHFVTQRPSALGIRAIVAVMLRTVRMSRRTVCLSRRPGAGPYPGIYLGTKDENIFPKDLSENLATERIADSLASVDPQGFSG